MADAQTIDQLAIEIKSHITGTSGIEKFTKAVDGLANASRRVDTKKLSSAAKNIRTFSDSLNGVKTNEIRNFSNALVRLSEIKSNNLSNLDQMAKSIKSLSSAGERLDGVRKLTNSLKNLANIDMSGFDASKFSNLSNSVSTLARSFSGIEGIDNKVTRLVDAIAKISNSGQYIGNVTTELPKMGNALTALIKDLQGVGTIDKSIASLVDGISRLANAGKKAADTTANLDKFGDAVVNLVNKIKGVGEVNSNLANTIQGLGNLAQSGVKYGAVASATTTHTVKLGDGFKRLGSVVGRIINPFNSLRDKMGIAQKRSKSLASSIGLLYAKFWMLARLVRGLGSMTGSAQNYIEAFNYFNVALQKIGQDSKDQYKRFGYDNATEYAESFQDRFTKLQKQMTGFDVNSRTGDLDYTPGRSLGLNVTDVMKYQAQISQITNSTGQLGEVSIMAAKAMSMLSADFSSLTNMDLTSVQENFVSALNGQTRAVYKFGVNLSSASLQQIAYNHGIDQSVAKLSMATKQQLRLIGMLEQSKVAFGDLGRTINQPANQLRMLQAGFSNLGRTIGSLFLPALQMIYPILNGIVMVLQEFFGWLAKLMGVKLPDMSSALQMPDIETPADDAGDLADNTGRAAKNAKKLSDNLQGFDEINKLDKNSGTGGTGGSPGAGGVGDYDLSDDLAKLLKNYQKIWDKAFNSTENKAYKWAKRIKEALLKGWNNGGDFTFLGLELGQAISEKLAKIPWDKIQAGVSKVTRSFATFLNGVVKGTNWKTIGSTIAEAFNTVVEALYTWYDTFDFLELGKSLAKGLNSIINRFNWQKFGKMLGKKLRGMIQLAFGFITNIDFENIGQKISDAINNFFDEMGRVDPRTGLSGWAELGKTISDGIKGLLDTIDEVLDKVNWHKVGKAIADFLGQIDWVGIFLKLGKVIAKALWTAIKTGITAFANDPIGVGTAIISVLGGLFAFGKLKALIGVIKVGFGKVFGMGIKQGVAQGMTNAGLKTGGEAVGGGLLSKFKNFGTKAAKFFKTGFKSNLKDIFLNEGDYQVSKGTFLGVGAAAAVVAGSAGGKLINEYLDAQTENEEAHRQAGKVRGEANLAIARANGQNVNQAYEARKAEIKKEIADISDRMKDTMPSVERNGFGTIRNFRNISDWLQKLSELRAEYEKLDGEMSSMNQHLGEYNGYWDAVTKDSENAATAQKKLFRMAEKGKISWHEYSIAVKKATDKNKKFADTTASSVKDRLGRAISSTQRYSKAVNELTKSMNDSHVPTEQQKTILNRLKDALMDGRISMKKYEDIVKSSKGNVQKLTNAINKIPARKKVHINTAVSGLKELRKNLQAIVNGKYTVHVNTVYDKGKQTGQVTNVLGGALSYQQLTAYQNKGLIVEGKTIKIPKTETGIIKTIKDLIDSHKLKGFKIEKYAQGGFIEDGLFTMNRNEIAGKFSNGKSVVANNEQISEGFAKSITSNLAPAIYSAVKQAVSEANQNGDNVVKVYLDGKQLADNSVKYIRQMNRSRNANVLA